MTTASRELRMGAAALRTGCLYDLTIVLWASDQVIELGTHTLPVTVYPRGRNFQIQCSPALTVYLVDDEEGGLMFASLMVLKGRMQAFFCEGYWTEFSLDDNNRQHAVTHEPALFKFVRSYKREIVALWSRFVLGNIMCVDVLRVVRRYLF